MQQRSRTLRNRFAYGVGTIGRDAGYTLIGMYLLFYLSDILEVSTGVFAAITVVLVITRVFDAVNDPFMGVIVDNTKGRFGKFKPWILSGGIASAALMVAMFVPLELGDAAFVAVFAAIYVAWSLAYTVNDLGYWTMLPALSEDQHERERIGSFARICASVGTFATVVAIVPVSTAIGNAIGDMRWSYFVVAVVIAVIMIALQLVTLIFVKEDRSLLTQQQHTRFRDLVRIVLKNDQLLTVAVAFVLFMVSFTITTSLGIYYFRYVYGDESVYSVFALVLGVSQITALACYPLLGSRLKRRTIFTWALFAVLIGYIGFFFTPPGALALVIVAGVIVFAAQAIIQLQMFMFIADTVEYGEHRFGRRNDSATLALQPFIYKLSSALASGVVGWVVIASGMKTAAGASDMTDGGVALVKAAMFIVPGALIALSYLVYRRFYSITEESYKVMLAELHERRAASDG